MNQNWRTTTAPFGFDPLSFQRDEFVIASQSETQFGFSVDNWHVFREQQDGSLVDLLMPWVQQRDEWCSVEQRQDQACNHAEDIINDLLEWGFSLAAPAV